MPWRARWAPFALGLLFGGGVAGVAGYLGWGRPGARMANRLAALESAATQVQADRERLRRELDDIVRERRKMTATAEHLRAQVERQLRRLEELSAELEPPAGETEPPAGAAP